MTEALDLHSFNSAHIYYLANLSALRVRNVCTRKSRWFNEVDVADSRILRYVHSVIRLLSEGLEQVETLALDCVAIS